MTRSQLCLIALESLSFRSYCNQVRSCCLAICHLPSAIGNSTAPLRPRQGTGTLLERSQVTVPFQGVLQRCDHNHEAMLVQSVDTAILADAETAYAIGQDLKKGLSLDA